MIGGARCTEYTVLCISVYTRWCYVLYYVYFILIYLRYNRVFTSFTAKICFGRKTTYGIEMNECNEGSDYHVLGLIHFIHSMMAYGWHMDAYDRPMDYRPKSRATLLHHLYPIPHLELNTRRHTMYCTPDLYKL